MVRLIRMQFFLSISIEDGQSENLDTSDMNVRDIFEVIQAKSDQLEYIALVKESEKNTETDW